MYYFRKHVSIIVYKKNTTRNFKWLVDDAKKKVLCFRETIKNQPKYSSNT